MEPVDPLSIDEAFESIEADMPDHDRWPSHAHLLPCVPVNTRRRARGVRVLAKPSMTISATLKKLLKTWLTLYKTWSTYLWSPLLFLCSWGRVWKGVDVERYIDRLPLAFYTWWNTHVKSNRSREVHRSRAPCFCWHVGALVVRAFVCQPLTSIESCLWSFREPLNVGMHRNAHHFAQSRGSHF
jgi:hypothetical protein